MSHLNRRLHEGRGCGWLQYTMEDSKLEGFVAVITRTIDSIISNNKYQFEHWLKHIDHKMSMNAREAILSMIHQITITLAREECGESLSFVAGSVSRKVLETLASDAIENLWERLIEQGHGELIDREDKWKVLRPLIKAAASALENKFSHWLENQGVFHWTEEAKGNWHSLSNSIIVFLP